jgi:hypothetical protein
MAIAYGKNMKNIVVGSLCQIDRGCLGFFFEGWVRLSVLSDRRQTKSFHHSLQADQFPFTASCSLDA